MKEFKLSDSFEESFEELIEFSFPDPGEAYLAFVKVGSQALDECIAIVGNTPDSPGDFAQMIYPWVINVIRSVGVDGNLHNTKFVEGSKEATFVSALIENSIEVSFNKKGSERRFYICATQLILDMMASAKSTTKHRELENVMSSGLRGKVNELVDMVYIKVKLLKSPGSLSDEDIREIMRKVTARFGSAKSEKS